MVILVLALRRRRQTWRCRTLPTVIAERRGRSVKLWCWMGFIFGPIAPLVVALLPPSDEPGGRPPGAPNGSRLWRRTHGRVSGGRGEPHSLDLVMIS
jgi:hypothetical protein